MQINHVCLQVYCIQISCSFWSWTTFKVNSFFAFDWELIWRAKLRQLQCIFCMCENCFEAVWHDVLISLTESFIKLFLTVRICRLEWNNTDIWTLLKYFIIMHNVKRKDTIIHSSVKRKGSLGTRRVQAQRVYIRTNELDMKCNKLSITTSRRQNVGYQPACNCCMINLFCWIYDYHAILLV